MGLDGHDAGLDEPGQRVGHVAVEDGAVRGVYVRGADTSESAEPQIIRARRGVILASCGHRGIASAEYAPAEIKSALMTTADTDVVADSVAENAVNGTVVGITGFAVDADATTNDDLRTLGDIKVDEVPSGTHVGLPMLCDVKPFDNLDLRLALKYATDRQQLMQMVLKGHGSIGNDHPISPIMPFFARILPGGVLATRPMRPFGVSTNRGARASSRLRPTPA